MNRFNLLMFCFEMTIFENGSKKTLAGTYLKCCIKKGFKVKHKP